MASKTKKRQHYPSKIDPTRTSGLRRSFGAMLRRQFSSLKADILRHVADGDAFGLKNRPMFAQSLVSVLNAFCPTGKGGGIDNSCSPNVKGSFDHLTDDPQIIHQLETAATEVPPAPLKMKRDVQGLMPEHYTGTVDGLRVRTHVPNEDSMTGFPEETSTILKGVREVSMSLFDIESIRAQPSQRAANTTSKLVDAIRESGEINPLIVVKDKQGWYVLEGNHRLPALLELGKKSFPAVVLVDHDGLTANVDRDQMPQIRKEHWDDFLTYVRSRTTLTEERGVDPSSLKAVQTEFSQERVDAIPVEKLQYPILISQDGYVLDGNHRWIKAHQTGARIKVLRIGMDVKDALAMMREFPQVEFVGNAGDNCGTGAGGFQPGNTCATKTSHAVLDMDVYDKPHSEKPLKDLRTYKTREQVKEDFGHVETQQANNLTDKERKAVTQYVEENNINSDLSNKQHTETIKQLDSAIDKSSFPVDAEVHRYIVIPKDSDYADLTGKTVSVPRYSSTSLESERYAKPTKNYADAYAEDNDGATIVKMQIGIKKGSPALLVGEISGGSSSEVILPRNAKLHIHSVEETTSLGGHKTLLVKASYAPETKTSPVPAPQKQTTQGPKQSFRSLMKNQPKFSDDGEYIYRYKSDAKGNYVQWTDSKGNKGLIRNELLINAEEYAYSSDPDKVKLFEEWLRTRFTSYIISQSSENLWKAYIQEGFMRGMGRAFDDVNVAKRARLPITDPRSGRARLDRTIKVTPTTSPAVPSPTQEAFYQGTREEFLRSAFGRPVAMEKVRLLAGRSFDELKDVTREMSNKISRVLVDGLVEGKGPREIARDMTKQVELSRQRATTIARTEIIRAHSNGQLESFKNLGIQRVGAAVEWSVTRTLDGTPDERVCCQCAPLNGIVLTLEEAAGLIPRHPNCRCAWTPANVGEDPKNQKRSKASIIASLRKSVGCRKVKLKEGEQGWAADKTISEDRPKSLIGVINTTNIIEQLIEYESLRTNVFCPTGEGGGVDPTCSPGGTAVHFKNLPKDVQHKISVAPWDSLNPELRDSTNIRSRDLHEDRLKSTDELFKHAVELKYPEKFVRGVSGTIYPMSEGAAFTEPGYLRLSNDQGTAEQFSERPGRTGQVLHLTLPKNSKVLPGDHVHEHEVYLPRGATFRVNKIESKENDLNIKGVMQYIHHIHAELVL